MLSEILSTLLAQLNALYAVHQSAHWKSMGDQFYGDHLMHKEMYNAISAEIDSVAEKILGMGCDDSLLDPMVVIDSTVVMMKMLVPQHFNASGYTTCSLMCERAFLKQLACSIDSLNEMNALTPGLDNLLQSIADKHESHVYMLSRRESKEVVKSYIAAVVGESIHNKKQKTKKKNKQKYIDIGGPISTGPGNPGFNSSSGTCG